MQPWIVDEYQAQGLRARGALESGPPFRNMNKKTTKENILIYKENEFATCCPCFRLIGSHLIGSSLSQPHHNHHLPGFFPLYTSHMFQTIKLILILDKYNLSKYKNAAF